MKKRYLARIGALGALAVALFAAQLSLPGGLPGAPGAGPAVRSLHAAPATLAPTDALEREAEQIFSGTVTDVRARVLGGGPYINTDADIKVTNRIKGSSDPSATVEVFGGKLGDRETTVTNQPVFYVGEEVFIFGKANPALAGLEVVAGQYGKLRVVNGRVSGPGRDQTLRSLVDEIVTAADAAGRTLDVGTLDETTTSAALPPAPRSTLFPWHWAGGSAAWEFNPTVPAGIAGVPDTATVESIMKSGFAQWQNAANLAITYRGQTSVKADGVLCASNPPVGACVIDGHNVLGWVSGLQTFELARTVCIRDGSGNALDCDIAFNPNLSALGATWATGGVVGAAQFDLVTAIVHEQGHFLGMGHSWAPQPDCSVCVSFPAQPSASDRAAVMYYIMSGGESRRALTCDDITGIRLRYDELAVCAGTSPTATATAIPTATPIRCPAVLPTAAISGSRPQAFLPSLRGGICK
jgi:hypothetical protein